MPHSEIVPSRQPQTQDSEKRILLLAINDDVIIRDHLHMLDELHVGFRVQMYMTGWGPSDNAKARRYLSVAKLLFSISYHQKILDNINFQFSQLERKYRGAALAQRRGWSPMNTNVTRKAAPATLYDHVQESKPSVLPNLYITEQPPLLALRLPPEPPLNSSASSA